MPKTLNRPDGTVTNGDPLRPVKSVSEQTSLPESTIYQLLDRGVIPVVRLPGVGSRKIIRVRQSSIDSYIASGSQ